MKREEGRAGVNGEGTIRIKKGREGKSEMRK